jgi:hypothetical protein
MNPDQIQSIIEAALTASKSEMWWTTTALSIVLVALVGGVSAYFGAYLRQSAQNSVMRRNVEEMTRLARNIEVQIKSRSEFLDKILLERYQLIREINKRLESVKYNYERLRKGAPTDLRIDQERGETLDLTELNQILDLNKAILGEDFYPILKQKYDRVIHFWNGALDWPAEEANWIALSTEIQTRMARVFQFDSAKLMPATGSNRET